ncbi:type I-B CRISPR-associated protein Cas5b [Bacillus sp. GX]|uniref:CRISPR-associated protein Cas5h n=1 Tax=Bacillus thuringiensis TaxID=1428 RepID=A0A4R4B3C7_BACTU|nr:MULTISPECIES: type I-B CRISPR-associated protein Cas5b [Bacillus cereus group]KAA0759078.1 type I-B CRISPR-associated protein Cas5 [Bacillus sp. AR2-1]TCW46911.1 CRISPR-associated protein Cas5h [Bacillus thuringiensis]TCW47141.1 CRISPR-associated protein Cas5h [Bacillus thuringiensis]
MEAIAFELKGRTAFFKKPDVNANVYFTYSHIHKIALYGLLGAIIGAGGYTQQQKSITEEGSSTFNQYPEFYQLLNKLKVSIVPHGDRGYFLKKIQVFNNTVGYASKEVGGNLIVREQWLEKPHWTIYLWNDGSLEEETYNKLKNYLISSTCKYVPYLGKNDHPATIEHVRLVELEEVDEVCGIESLVYSKDIFFSARGTYDNNPIYFFQEYIPIQLNPELNYYEFDEIVHTNRKIKQTSSTLFAFQTEGRVIAFI